MNYQIRVPRICGDVFPLVAVAEAIAFAKATCYGTEDFHKPGFKDNCRIELELLMAEVQAGRLQLCNLSGTGPATFDDTDTDWQRNGEVFAINIKHYSKTNLHYLNLWGANAGNTFSLDPNGRPWIDERGVMGLDEVFDDVTAPVATETKAAPAETLPGIVHKITNRTQPLDAEIEVAEGNAINRDNAQSVWAELTTLAESGTGAMIGYSSDGIQHRGTKYRESGEPDVFTFKNLRDRMSRKRAKTLRDAPGRA